MTLSFCCPHYSIRDVARWVTEKVRCQTLAIQWQNDKKIYLLQLSYILCPLFEHPVSPRCILGWLLAYTLAKYFSVPSFSTGKIWEKKQRYIAVKHHHKNLWSEWISFVLLLLANCHHIMYVKQKIKSLKSVHWLCGRMYYKAQKSDYSLNHIFWNIIFVLRVVLKRRISVNHSHQPLLGQIWMIRAKLTRNNSLSSEIPGFIYPDNKYPNSIFTLCDHSQENLNFKCE